MPLMTKARPTIFCANTLLMTGGQVSAMQRLELQLLATANHKRMSNSS